MLFYFQLAERAVIQVKQRDSEGSWALTPLSPCQLEEAQVFWAKGEQELALDLLRRMINNMEEMVSPSTTVSPPPPPPQF